MFGTIVSVGISPPTAGCGTARAENYPIVNWMNTSRSWQRSWKQRNLSRPELVDMKLDAYQALATGTPFEATAEGVLARPDITDPQRGHPDALALVRTSGSTGTPKQTLLTASALAASAQA